MFTQTSLQSVGVAAGQSSVHVYVLPLAAQSGSAVSQEWPHEPQLVGVEIGVSQPPDVGPVQCS